MLKDIRKIVIFHSTTLSLLNFFGCLFSIRIWYDTILRIFYCIAVTTYLMSFIGQFQINFQSDQTKPESTIFTQNRAFASQDQS